jgi:hypothetical protein
MPTAVTRVPAAELANELAEMRKWLDKNGIEPLKFISNRYGSIVGIYLEFGKEMHAEAFRSRFGDEKRRRPHDELLHGDYRWTLDFRGSGAAQTRHRETMAQACWWRLRAEEVRAEADGLNSASAQATMRTVAETWDRMAEDLERRLARSQR